MVILEWSVQSWRKICAYTDFLRFFLICTVGAAHSLNSTFDNMPMSTNRFSSLFISSVPANGTFRFFLKMGRVFSFSSNFALIFVHLPRPAENTSGNYLLVPILIFSASAVISETNPTQTNFLCSSVRRLKFLVIPFSDTGIIISPSNFILSPVTVRTV